MGNDKIVKNPIFHENPVKTRKNTDFDPFWRFWLFPLGLAWGFCHFFMVFQWFFDSFRQIGIVAWPLYPKEAWWTGATGLRVRVSVCPVVWGGGGVPGSWGMARSVDPWCCTVVWVRVSTHCTTTGTTTVPPLGPPLYHHWVRLRPAIGPTEASLWSDWGQI